jgi:hypothetical protein
MIIILTSLQARRLSENPRPSDFDRFLLKFLSETERHKLQLFDPPQAESFAI